LTDHRTVSQLEIDSCPYFGVCMRDVIYRLKSLPFQSFVEACGSRYEECNWYKVFKKEGFYGNRRL